MVSCLESNSQADEQNVFDDVIMVSYTRILGIRSAESSLH